MALRQSRLAALHLVAAMAWTGVLAGPALAQEWTPGVGVTWSGVKYGNDALLANVHGYLWQGTTMAPLRGFAEALGARVDYAGGVVTVALGQAQVVMQAGSGEAMVDGYPSLMTQPMTVFAGVSCVPVRFLAETFELQVKFNADGHKWACADHVLFTAEDSVFVMLVHQAPPPTVARFVADMQSSQQRYHDADGPSAFELGVWGVDWLIPVMAVASDGAHMMSLAPGTWEHDPQGSPQEMWFDCGDFAVYGIRDARWQFLTSFEDRLTPDRCGRIGLPLNTAREMGAV